MQPHKIVSGAEWIAARKAHLAAEKKFTEARDELSRQRRELPWVKVDKPYVFEGPQGKETLAELFGGRSQLIVYHFMFGPGWEQGCPSCSFLSDHFDGAIVHLAQRDVTMLAVSRAPLPQIEAFKKRMGWRFKWVSSFGSDFNRDYQVSFTKDELEQSKAYYNYKLAQAGAAASGTQGVQEQGAGAVDDGSADYLGAFRSLGEASGVQASVGRSSVMGLQSH